jgi:hypothetical protein
MVANATDGYNRLNRVNPTGGYSTDEAARSLKVESLVICVPSQSGNQLRDFAKKLPNGCDGSEDKDPTCLVLDRKPLAIQSDVVERARDGVQGVGSTIFGGQVRSIWSRVPMRRPKLWPISFGNLKPSAFSRLTKP